MDNDSIMHTVLKFGGTSMDDEQTWRQVIDIIGRYTHPWVVVSATAKTTRHLLSAADAAQNDMIAARQIQEEIRDRHLTLIHRFMSHYPRKKIRRSLKLCEDRVETCMNNLTGYLREIHESGESGDRIRDAVASVGEQLSSYLFTECARLEGLPAQWIDARAVIRTDSQFGRAEPDTGHIERAVKRMTDNMFEHTVPVMGGYYGENGSGEITTLGFEGSDYTASLIGAALGAEAIEIWTDVSGVYTCDPRSVEDARPIAELSFSEATELASFGAKVLHPSTLKPAVSKNIPVFVKNIFAPEEKGTRISRVADGTVPVRAIAWRTEDGKGIIGLVGCDPEQREELTDRINETMDGNPAEIISDSDTSLHIVTEPDRTLDLVRRLHSELIPV